MKILIHFSQSPVRLLWTCLLVSSTTGAHAALSDFVNVKIGKKGVDVIVKTPTTSDGWRALPGVEISGPTNAATTMPVPRLPDVPGVSPSPGGRGGTGDVTTPPAGQALPPVGATGSETGSVTPSSASPQNSSVTGIPVPAVAPKVTVVPLQNIQAIYDSIKDDPAARESFCVSRDGRHCASFKRLGLTSWTVQVDGLDGPEMKGLVPEGVNGMSRKIFPTDDFSQVFYLALNAQSESVLVVQNKDGSAKAYTVATKNDSAAWMADAAVSLTNRRLIRSRKFEVPNEGTRYQMQVDEDGPVLGPFADRPEISFDASHKRYLMNAMLPVLIQNRNSYSARQPALLLDGVRVGQNLLPELTYGRSSGVRAAELVAGNGAYFIRLPGSNGGTKDVLSGRTVAEYPRELSIPPRPVFSPDGTRLASVVSSAKGPGIHVDGAVAFSHPIGTVVDRLQFTGDSRGLVYAVGSSPRISVFVDERETWAVANGVLDRLWAGPHRGQYACLVRKAGAQELVINGRSLSYCQQAGDRTVNYPAPEKLWFTADGQHVFGYWMDGSGNLCCFVDNQVTKASLPGRAIAANLLLEPVRTNDFHWQIVRAKQNGVAYTGSDLFIRVEVEIPVGQVAKGN